MRRLYTAILALAVAAACGPRPQPAPQVPPPAYGGPRQPPPPPPDDRPAPPPEERPIEPAPEEPPRATAHEFYYYPELEAYWCRAHDQYYWRQDMAGWQMQKFQPTHLDFQGSRSVPVTLSGREPTDADLARHRAEYPPER